MMGYIKSGGYKQQMSANNTSINNIDINLFPYLNNVAMIRELHVYGNMTPVNKQNNKIINHHQHRGFGRILIEKAEEIARNNNYNKIAVISGVGVRKYYEKFEYKLKHNYMIKDLYFYHINNYIKFNIIIIIISIIISFLLVGT